MNPETRSLLMFKQKHNPKHLFLIFWKIYPKLQFYWFLKDFPKHDILYSFSIRKVWEGEFQIVLTKENKNNLLNQSDLLQGLALSGLNLQSDGDPLKTEVGILKSPLVLDSVFNYVKKAKSSNKKDNIDNLSFRKWKNTYLNINLELILLY